MLAGEARTGQRLRTWVKMQVMWGTSPSGPFTNTATGYSRGYIQVRCMPWACGLAYGSQTLMRTAPVWQGTQQQGAPF